MARSELPSGDCLGRQGIRRVVRRHARVSLAQAGAEARQETEATKRVRNDLRNPPPPAPLLVETLFRGAAGTRPGARRADRRGSESAPPEDRKGSARSRRDPSPDSRPSAQSHCVEPCATRSRIVNVGEELVQRPLLLLPSSLSKRLVALPRRRDNGDQRVSIAVFSSATASWASAPDDSATRIKLEKLTTSLREGDEACAASLALSPAAIPRRFS